MISNRTSLFGRRDFLRIGSLGALGISLDSLLRAGAKRDISCILLWQSGCCLRLSTRGQSSGSNRYVGRDWKMIRRF